MSVLMKVAAGCLSVAKKPSPGFRMDSVRLSYSVQRDATSIVAVICLTDPSAARIATPEILPVSSQPPQF